jgi:hypothetical protein
MRLSLKIVAGLAVVALIATVWLKDRAGNRDKSAAQKADADKSAMSENIKALRHAKAVSITSANRVNAPNTPHGTSSQEPNAELAEWETRIDDILADESDNDLQKSRKLLALLPKLPQDGQIEAITHAVNLLDDEHYAPLTELVTNALTSEEVLDVLTSDLANRTNTLKLPVLLQIARQQKHPMAAEAQKLLELYVNEDYGTDWTAWEKAIQEWLKEERESTIPAEKNL